MAEECAKALRGVGPDGNGRWWWRGVGERVGILGAVRGQVAEAWDFVGGKTRRAWGRVKVWFRVRVNSGRGAGVASLEAISADPWVETSSRVKERELAIFQLYSWDMRAVGSRNRPVG